MTVVLKPGFAPIEQYQTRGQGSFTDIYALCATIYYCITGNVPPASPERLTETFDNHPDPLIPPSKLGVSISPKQEQILMWGLALQPSVRPQDIAVVALRLENVSASESKTEYNELKTGYSEPGGTMGNFETPGTEKKEIWHKIVIVVGVVVAAIILIWLL